MQFAYNDGGRADAGYKGITSDCVTRSIAIATELPYRTVYNALNALGRLERPAPSQDRSNARKGVYRITYQKYLLSLGWTWSPTRCHLRASELPSGHLVCRVTKHLVAVVDGVIHDLDDCSCDGKRYVYGYFTPATLE
jgi:hypothetical protein